MKKEVRHIAIIPDGNRRWAASRGLSNFQGYEAGVDKLNEFLDWITDLNVKEYTLYCFSIKNFQRDPQEVDCLISSLLKMFIALPKKNNFLQKVRINFLGQTWLFNQEVQEKQQELMDLTRKNSDFIVNFAMGYGGKEELLEGIKKLAKEVKDGTTSLDEINKESFSQYLSLDSEPDLIIRTGGENRLSNFLPWQSSYSELLFVKKYWPEIVKEDLTRIIAGFQG